MSALGTANARSTGHASSLTCGSTVKETAWPLCVSETVEPYGTAPGCQVSVAVASTVATAPAAATASVAAETAVADPAGACAVTATLSAWPRSSVDGRYVSAVAPGISAQFAPLASHRCHWYPNVSGLPPVQSPGTAVTRLPV